MPLACRSSSLLEDALGRPFAGVYGTKMIPSNQPDADARFRALVDAVKFVFASTFFRAARAYRGPPASCPSRRRWRSSSRRSSAAATATASTPTSPASRARTTSTRSAPREPEDGVVDLALGLGKTIVDGGALLVVLPRPPAAAAAGRLGARPARRTQTQFWAVNVGPPPPYDPMTETEYLVEAQPRRGRGGRHAALRRLDLRRRLRPARPRHRPARARASSTSRRSCAWNELPLVPALRKLLAVCEEELGPPVEIEFALSAAAGRARRASASCRCGRCSSRARRSRSTARGPRLAARASSPRRAALGNGRHEVRDVVYVEPASFEARLTPAIAGEIERLNRALRRGRPALPADRLRPLGLDRPLARHPGALGPDRRGARDRRGDAAADEPRAQPGLALLPQPLELLASSTSPCRSTRGRGGRLGLARETGDRGPHRARPARAHAGAPRPARGRALAARRRRARGPRAT